MADVLLKTGKIIQIPLEEMEDYLRANSSKIQTRKIKRRGDNKKHGS